MTTYYYGDLHNYTDKKLNIHDLNKVNHIKLNNYSFSNLNKVEKVLANISSSESDKINYMENGITQEEEDSLKGLLVSPEHQTLFTMPVDDVLYAKNKSQNYFTIDIMLNGAMLKGQYPRLNYIEYNINNIEIDTISEIHSDLDNWSITFVNNKIIMENLIDTFEPLNDQLYTLFTVKYIEPAESWNRQVNIQNLVMKSYNLEHITLTNKTLFVSELSGGNVYNFQSLNYLASHNFISKDIRIKPVNHSQQDNMFIIFDLDFSFAGGDILFAVDQNLFIDENNLGEDNVFGNEEFLKVRNYLCGWYEFTDSNLNSTKYIAVYNDSTLNRSNVNYSYKFFSSSENVIYDLNVEQVQDFKAIGYGSVSNPIIFSKYQVSNIISNINDESVYDLFVEWI